MKNARTFSLISAILFVALAVVWGMREIPQALIVFETDITSMLRAAKIILPFVSYAGLAFAMLFQSKITALIFTAGLAVSEGYELYKMFANKTEDFEMYLILEGLAAIFAFLFAILTLGKEKSIKSVWAVPAILYAASYVTLGIKYGFPKNLTLLVWGATVLAFAFMGIWEKRKV